MLKGFSLSLQIRVDDEDDEIMVNDQSVEKLVIVTQVRSWAAAALLWDILTAYSFKILRDFF